MTNTCSSSMSGSCQRIHSQRLESVLPVFLSQKSVRNTNYIKATREFDECRGTRMLIGEIVSGIISGLMYGLISSAFVICLAMIFNYFTGEVFPWFIGMSVGLGIVGISGGLLALLDEPTPLSVTRIMVASMVLVLATNEGNRLGTKLPRKRISLISSLRATGRQDLTTVRIPLERDIEDIPGKPRVSVMTKRRLSNTEFLLPAGLPREDLENRLKRRLLSDWELGDIELELDQKGKLTYFAVSGRERSLTTGLREGLVALPMKYDAAPSGLASGDSVRVYSDTDLLADSVQVKGVDERNRTITLEIATGDLEGIVGKKATQIVALPRVMKEMIVEEIMTRNVCTVSSKTSLRDAISLMNERRVGSIVVVEEDKAVGIVTDRDILQRIAKRNVDLSKKVVDLMSKPLVDVSSDASVEEAIRIMRNRSVKNLPVTCDGRLVGIVSSEDILRATSPKY